MKWRIYYGDGHYSDDLTRKTDVQFVAEIYEGRKYMHMGGEWFCYNGRWKCRAKPKDIALKGKQMGDDEFEALKAEAFEWLLQA